MGKLSKPLKALFISLLCILIAYLVAWNSPYKSMVPGYHLFLYTPQKYTQTLRQINQMKGQLIGQKPEKIKPVLISSLTQKVFPFWYGTTWGFYGCTTTPGNGTIACGYFVTTTLKQIGLNLNREHLAQCASEQMIRSLVQKKYIWHFNDLSIEAFIHGLKFKGTGLYIVGLDNHTGFIYVQSASNIRFIHSSGRFPFCVLNENAAESIVLKKSSYKVVGKISDDPLLLAKWVNGARIP